MKKEKEKEIREVVLGLGRNKKLKILKDLLKDFGEQYITVHNLSEALKISEDSTRRCFRLFDKRQGVTIMPGFLNYPEFKELWQTRDVTKDPRQLLDLLGRANKFVKAPEGSGNEEFSAVKSRLYSAKSQIIWQLRHLVEEVAIEKQEDGEACFAITLETGHQFHQPIRTSVKPDYWMARVKEERPYHQGELIDTSGEDIKYYRAIADLLFYLQRRGLNFENGVKRD